MKHQMKQFDRNFGIMTESLWEEICQTKVMLVGLGGLGGHIANSLARFGIRSLILVDFDCFELSNINRQLFSTHSTLGQSKTAVFLDELPKINPNIALIAYPSRIQDIDVSVFDTVDIVIDAVDDISTKLFLETIVSMHHKVLLHGAVGGWFGQIGILTEEAHLLSELYGKSAFGDEKSLLNPAFAPAIVANMMVSEFVKYRMGNAEALVNKIMMLDLLHHDYRVVLQKNVVERK